MYLVIEKKNEWKNSNLEVNMMCLCLGGSGKEKVLCVCLGEIFTNMCTHDKKLSLVEYFTKQEFSLIDFSCKHSHC